MGDHGLSRAELAPKRIFDTRIVRVDVMTLAREAEIRALGLLGRPAPDALEHLVGPPHA